MQNIKLYLQYNGTKYLGWADKKTVFSPRYLSTRLSDILGKLTGTPPTLYCSHKTEKGVHALSQCVSFQFCGSSTPEKLADYINRYLPSDIRLLSLSPAPPTFRADLYAKKKYFEYHVCTDSSYFPFIQHLQYLWDGPVPYETLQNTAQLFTGKHDFSSFTFSPKKKGNEKTVFSCSIVPKQHGFIIRFDANDFLPGMALAIPGAILASAKGQCSDETIQQALTSFSTTEKMPFAPPHALYLKKTVYH